MARRLAAVALALQALLLGTCLAQSRAFGGDARVASGPCTPQQIHVSLTGNPTELRVSWKTAAGSCPSGVISGPAAALSSTPIDPTHLTAHTGSQHTYTADDMCSAPARTLHFGTAYLHTAVLTGLEPGERHFYQIEGGIPIEFVAPVPAGPTHSFRFLVFGDMGDSDHKEAKSPGAWRTVAQLQEEYEAGAELVMHVGDISYANGRNEIWDAFMDSIEPFARHIPYMVAVGNHEYDYERGPRASPDASGETSPYRPDWSNYGNDSGGECGVAISRRFVMPDVSDYGYWTHGSGITRSSTSGSSSSSSSSGGSSSSSSSGSKGGGTGNSRGGSRASSSSRLRNPTLGPDAVALLASAAAEQQQQQEQEQEEQAAAAGGDSLNALPPARPNPPFWYSFSHGSVHFVVISTEHDLRPGSRQYRWLERDLRLVDRCSTPWVVLSMHRPMYVVYPHKSNRIVGDHLREQLEGLLDEHRVDLVLSGHVHSYSRTCNVLDEHCVPADRGGMTHIIVGCAGRKLTDVSHAQEEWLEYAAVRYGYGRVTVNSGFSLLFEMVGDDGVVHDSVRLHNGRASLRGCSYAPGVETEAVLAAAAAAEAEAACPGSACAEGAPGLQRGGGSAAEGAAAQA